MSFIRLTFLAITLALALALAGSVPAAEETSPPKGVADFRSLKELLEVVPKHVLVELKSPKDMEAAKAKANAAFEQKALFKWITLKIKVAKCEPFEAEGVIPIKYRVEAQEETANVSGTAVGVHIWVNLGADAEKIVPRLVRGAELTVTSYLNRVELTNNPGEEMKLNLVMARTKVKPTP